jgi:molybdopterin converting factor small subunit
MKVRVLFFGATADAIGKREIEMDLADETRSQAAFAAVLEKFPQLNQHSLLFAVNQEYAGDETIQNGDELAIFTAVSGG